MSAPEWVNYQRAQRMLAPAAGAVNHALAFDALVAGRLESRTHSAPPDLPDGAGCVPFSEEWLKVLGDHELASRPGGREFLGKWNRWLLENQLEFTRATVEPIRDGTLASGRYVSHSLAGRWTLAQASAWIASKDERLPERHDGGFGGRRVIRVRFEVSEHFCRCRASRDKDHERWELCQCTKEAFETLRSAMLDASAPLRAWNRPSVHDYGAGRLNWKGEPDAVSNDWQRPGQTLVRLTEDQIAALQWPTQADGLIVVSPDVDRVEFEEREIRGRWPAATAQAARLKPIADSDLQDFLTVYVRVHSPLPDVDRVIHPAVQSAFPDKSITRDRVRTSIETLVGVRDPGPRP